MTPLSALSQDVELTRQGSVTTACPEKTPAGQTRWSVPLSC